MANMLVKKGTPAARLLLVAFALCACANLNADDQLTPSDQDSNRTGTSRQIVGPFVELQTTRQPNLVTSALPDGDAGELSQKLKTEAERGQDIGPFGRRRKPFRKVSSSQPVGKSETVAQPQAAPFLTDRPEFPMIDEGVHQPARLPPLDWDEMDRSSELQEELPEPLPKERIPPSEFLQNWAERGFGVAAPSLQYPNAGRETDPRLGPYVERAEQAPQLNWISEHAVNDVIPSSFRPWWEQLVQQPIWNENSAPLRVSVDRLVDSAVEFSPNVQALLTEPEIRQAQIGQELAAFDWTSFLETQYDDINEPIGSTLTTGNNADRYKDKNWEMAGGVRRRTDRGGEFEIAQEIGTERNNSSFLQPNPQANSRLELSFIQPLLRGAGKDYNRSRVILATIDSKAMRDEVSRQLQTHVVRVAEVYWELFRARSALVQRKRLLEEAELILANLEARRIVDAQQRQVLRARAAVAQRRAEIVRAENDIKNAEARLRFLVNSPDLVQDARLELLPLDAPPLQLPPVGMRESLLAALQSRQDISAALHTINASMIRLGVAKKDLLPKLDLLLSSRIDGLESESAIGESLGNQFADGRPTVGLGFNFEFPLGNRLSKAQLNQREWEAQRALREFDQTVSQALLDVEVAARNYLTAERELIGRFESLTAAAEEVDYLQDRWGKLAGVGDSATLLLENLLDAQERRTSEEAAFVEAQIAYSLGLVQLRFAMGTLIQVEAPW